MPPQPNHRPAQLAWHVAQRSRRLRLTQVAAIRAQSRPKQGERVPASPRCLKAWSALGTPKSGEGERGATGGHRSTGVFVPELVASGDFYANWALSVEPRSGLPPICVMLGRGDDGAGQHRDRAAARAGSTRTRRPAAFTVAAAFAPATGGLHCGARVAANGRLRPRSRLTFAQPHSTCSTRHHVAAFDSRDNKLLSWNPDANSAHGVFVVAHSRRRVAFGGFFTRFGGRAQQGIAVYSRSGLPR
jgi:hypothetical protein